jgi:hypothetical protein
MNKQVEKKTSNKIDPLFLSDFMIILTTVSSVVSLSMNLNKILEVLNNKERETEKKLWLCKADEVLKCHENYKWLTKEILLMFNEMESNFGEHKMIAGNLLVIVDRNRFYRLLELKRDLSKLSFVLTEIEVVLDKFVIENNFPEFKLEKEDELLRKFDSVLSLWCKGTFNDVAQELKELNRLIEKALDPRRFLLGDKE